MRHIGLRAIASLVLLVTFSYAAPGVKETPVVPDESLALVPSGSMVVVQMNGHERLKQRANKLIENALPEQSKMIAAQIDSMLGQIVEGRDLKAIRGDARLILAASDFGPAAEPQSLTVLLPIKEFEDFKKSFFRDEERKNIQKEKGFEAVSIQEKTFYLVPVKGYLGLASDLETAKKISEGKAGGLASLMSKDTLKAFSNADLSVFVNLKEINKKYSEDIKGMKMLAGAAFANGGMGIPGVSKAQMDMLKSVLDGMFQMVEDGVGFVIALDVRPEGMNLKLMSQFAEKTPTAAFLSSFKPSNLDEINNLPGGMMGYTVSKLGAKKAGFSALLGGISLAEDSDAKVSESLKALTKEISDYDQTVTLSTSNSLYGGGIEVVESKDAGKMMAAQIKLMKTLTGKSVLSNVNLKNKPEIQEKALKVGDFEFTKIVTKFDFDKAVEGFPEEIRESAKSSMRRAMNGEELTNWFAVVGDKYLTITAKEPKEAKELVEKYLNKASSVAKDEAVQTTRQQLPSDANWMILLDGAKTAYSIFGTLKESIGAVPGLPVALPELKAPNGKPAYFGVALTLKPEHGSIDIFVPSKAILEIRNFLGPIFNMDN